MRKKEYIRVNIYNSDSDFKYNYFQMYKSTIDDMDYLSELGNGTSGNVVKMLHKPSQKVIAVKVC